MESYPSGKGQVCKTSMQRFDSARRLTKGCSYKRASFCFSSSAMAKPGVDYIYAERGTTPFQSEFYKVKLVKQALLATVSFPFQSFFFQKMYIYPFSPGISSRIVSTAFARSSSSAKTSMISFPSR